MTRSLCLGLVVAGLFSLSAFGQTAEVAVLVDPGGRREAAGAQEFLARMESTLRAGGVPYALVTQDQMLGGALDDFAVTIVPYAPNLSGAGMATLQAFCHEGGSVICFYTTYGLGDALGVRATTYVGDQARTMFRRVKLDQDALPGLPAGFAQTSWNINAPAADADGTVLGDWLKVDGAEAGYPAAVFSDNGLYFSHVLLPDTPEDERLAGQMLAAVVEHLGERRGTRRDIAIVYGSASEAVEGGDGRIVRRQVEAMSRILSTAGLAFTVLPDEAVARGALHDRKVAIFPLNFALVEGERDAVRSFVEKGGKVIGCFSANAALYEFMGVASGQFRQGGQATPFQVVEFNAGAPGGFPASFAQRSSNIIASTAAPDAQVIATWHDEAGTDTGEPAVILGPNGMFFSYILMTGELDKTSQFLLAAIAHLAGDDVYADAAELAASRLWDFRRYGDRDALLEACKGEKAALDLARQAVTQETAARVQLAEGDARSAYEGFREARATAEKAFIRNLPAGPEREFRGAWIHSVTIPGQDWNAFFAGMAKSHLNALLPNVCAGGYAHYESDLLPTSQFVQENGPQMEAMMAAAKKHGIEIHLWRVNWNMWYPGADVVAQLAAENRVCRDPEGNVISGPGSASLCPSHPLNRQLEIDAMLEMTRKFHPDGIHFDYIRYPGGQACYCVGCRERFEKLIARPVDNWPADVLGGGALQQDYLQFRRDQITAVVREVSRRSREIDPNGKISAAVFSQMNARGNGGQGWALWVQEGYLDFVCPMNYTQDVAGLGTTVASQAEWVGGRIPLQSGIGVWRSESPWHTADLVDTARARGADGLTFFEYRGRVVSQLIPALLDGPFRNPAKTPWAD